MIQRIPLASLCAWLHAGVRAVALRQWAMLGGTQHHPQAPTPLLHPMVGLSPRTWVQMDRSPSYRDGPYVQLVPQPQRKAPQAGLEARWVQAGAPAHRISLLIPMLSLQGHQEGHCEIHAQFPKHPCPSVEIRLCQSSSSSITSPWRLLTHPRSHLPVGMRKTDPVCQPHEKNSCPTMPLRQYRCALTRALGLGHESWVINLPC